MFSMYIYLILHFMKYVENIVQRGRPQMTTWRMRIAYWTPRAAHALVIRCTYCFSNGCTIANQCYVIRTVPLLLICP